MVWHDYVTARRARRTDAGSGGRDSVRVGREIVVADANGSNDRRLTYTGGSHPAWSPNGKLIAFERAGYIWTMRVNGKRQKRLVRGVQPAWQALTPKP